MPTRDRRAGRVDYALVDARVTDVKDVARAYLEPSGMVSVIRADRAEPDQPAKPHVAG